MANVPQIKVPATYIRGGTSKGVFFRVQDLPETCQQPGPARDKLLMRVIGSPDPYGKQIDGMGGATSSTSKTVLLAKSTQPDHDVDYLFGQVAIDKPFIDWSGNCGNLTAAVGAFAISNGLVDAERVPANGMAVIRIWQVNIQKTIIAHVPMTDGQVQAFVKSKAETDLKEDLSQAKKGYLQDTLIETFDLMNILGTATYHFQKHHDI